MEEYVSRWDQVPVPQYAANATRVAVIIEPRKHPFLRPVIRNHQAMLQSLGFTFCLYTSEANVPWANTLLNYEVTSTPSLKIRPLPFDNLNQIMYSKLLMTPAFWEELAPAEWVLIFQTDCVMFRPLSGEWLTNPALDYIGGNYYNPNEVAPFSGGVQGGFSLRRRCAMLQCLERITWEDVHRYRAHLSRSSPSPQLFPPIPLYREFEDIYFTHAAEMLGLGMPSPNNRGEFAIEAEFHPSPIGCHGWNKKYFTDAQITTILQNAHHPC